jgi:hypothetical protein
MTEIRNHSFSACCWTGVFNGGFERWQCGVGHGPRFADAEPEDVVADTDTGAPYFGGCGWRCGADWGESRWRGNSCCCDGRGCWVGSCSRCRDISFCIVGGL